MIDITKIKHVHCIGIGGVGLSAIAEILNNRGYEVSGSDMKASDLTTRLQKKGIKVYFEHNENNAIGADLIVYSAAVSVDNPELMYAKANNIPTLTRAQMLGILMDEYDNSIAISGVHGKTTTTSMVSLILDEAKKEPTILVGGNLKEIGGNVKIGKSDFFITEACEYMDSFLSLRPKIEVILNIDADHLDYFKDVEHIVESFEQFAKLLPEDGILIAYEANPFVKRVIDKTPNSITFGYGDSANYSIQNIEFSGHGQSAFDIYHKGELLERVELLIPGQHNILNATAAFATCHQLGVDVSSIVCSLKKFKGTERRFDVLGVLPNNIKVVDDYAHHPTEIKATLDAASAMNYNKLWCVFQPHTYTRTIALYEEFANSFEKADVLIVNEIYAAREKNIHKISSEQLAERIKEIYPDKEVIYIKEFDDIKNYIKSNAKDNDLVVLMGAGDIFKVGEMLLEDN